MNVEIVLPICISHNKLVGFCQQFHIHHFNSNERIDEKDPICDSVLIGVGDELWSADEFQAHGIMTRVLGDS